MVEHKGGPLKYRFCLSKSVGLVCQRLVLVSVLSFHYSFAESISQLQHPSKPSVQPLVESTQQVSNSTVDLTSMAFQGTFKEFYSVYKKELTPGDALYFDRQAPSNSELWNREYIVTAVKEANGGKYLIKKKNEDSGTEMQITVQPLVIKSKDVIVDLDVMGFSSERFSQLDPLAKDKDLKSFAFILSSMWLRHQFKKELEIRWGLNNSKSNGNSDCHQKLELFRRSLEQAAISFNNIFCDKKVLGLEIGTNTKSLIKVLLLYENGFTEKEVYTDRKSQFHSHSHSSAGQTSNHETSLTRTVAQEEIKTSNKKGLQNKKTREFRHAYHLVKLNETGTESKDYLHQTSTAKNIDLAGSEFVPLEPVDEFTQERFERFSAVALNPELRELCGKCASEVKSFFKKP